MCGQHKYPTEVLRAYLNSLLFLEPKVLLPCLYSKNLINLAEMDIKFIDVVSVLLGVAKLASIIAF